MNHSQFKRRMKPLYFVSLCLFTLVPDTGTAQPKIFSDSRSLQSILFREGDVVEIRCDSVYVMNALTFRRYDSAYKDLRRKGAGIGNLMSAYDEIIALQDERLKEQNRSYEELRGHFLTLSGGALETVNVSSTRLSAAVDSMENLNHHLVETKALLGEAREIIEREQRGLNLEKILWGAGGVAVGVVLGVLIAK